MEGQESQGGTLRRAVNDVVMAELFLIQATLESASAIGDGVGSLVGQNADQDESTAQTLQRIADDALEPYASRLPMLKEMLNAWR